jgi:hypothetical protein
MPTQQDMVSALRATDAAGDTAGAQRIAAMIKAEQDLSDIMWRVFRVRSAATGVVAHLAISPTVH